MMTMRLGWIGGGPFCCAAAFVLPATEERFLLALGASRWLIAVLGMTFGSQ
jgi:hypothetical protein